MTELKKYKRTKDRHPENFPDECWKEGYEFEGAAYPEYNQVQENAKDDNLFRIHNFDSVIEVK